MNTSTLSTYINNDETANASNLLFGNVGFVYASRPELKSKWKAVNYGFSMHTMNDYRERSTYRGENFNSSILDAAVFQANSQVAEFGDYAPDTDPFFSSLFWQSQLIRSADPDSASRLDTGFFSLYDGLEVSQIGDINNRGRTRDYNFSVAANYNNQLYIGGGVSLMTSTFRSNSKFTEQTDRRVSELTYEESILTEADGFMLRLGVILQPVPWVRFGVSYESPTRYTVTDEYRTSLSSQLDNELTPFVVQSQTFRPFMFRYRTSGRTTISGAILFSGKGLISFDYDVVPYDNIKASTLRNDNSAADWASNINTVIQSTFDVQNNFRVGGEYIIGPIALRMGYANWGSPFREGINTGGGDRRQNDFTGGFGFKFDNISFDFSIIHARWTGYRSTYSAPDIKEEGVVFNHRRTIGMISLGFRLD